jgi:hypothetical protein
MDTVGREVCVVKDESGRFGVGPVAGKGGKAGRGKGASWSIEGYLQSKVQNVELS